MIKRIIACFLIFTLNAPFVNADIFDPENTSVKWVCGSDLNSNGYVGDEGESAACLGTLANSKYCPISSALCTQDQGVETAPPICEKGSLDSSGQCSVSGKECRYSSNDLYIRSVIFGSEYWSGFWNGVQIAAFTTSPSTPPYSAGNFVEYVPNKGWYYQICKGGGTVTAPPSCPAGFSYNSSNKQCEKVTYTDKCPLGDYACVPDGAARYCSPNKCVDKNNSDNNVIEDIDGNMLIDDGAKNNDGLCLEQVFIYNGRKQRCKTPGVQSAWKDCCEDGGKALLDDAGSLSSMGSAANTISNLYTVAEVAYTTYTAQVAAGVSEAFAGELAASAAQQQMLVAFDPTSMAIAIAMYFIMKWLANACDQMDMETAMANSSGYCIEVGEFCKKEVKFIGCVQKAKSFCCFNSKLARIIQEQGRPQLTTINGFGTPTEPNCRGFTPEEFQRIDFSRIDLTEYVEELQKNTQEQVQENIQKITEEFFNKVK